MNVQHLWLGQATHAPRISLDYVRHRATSVERGIRRRAAINYAAYAFALFAILWVAWRTLPSQPLMFASMAYFACLMSYAVYRLRRYVAQQASPAEAGVLDTLRFHRQQLERQRDYRRWDGRWGVAAVLWPGVGLKIAAMWAYSFPWSAIFKVMGIVTLGSIFVLALSEYRARQVQREIDALDSLAGDP